jgi:tripeptidyl-peptidase II
VHRAFDYLQRSATADKPDVRYAVAVKRSDSAKTTRGVYLRDSTDFVAPATFSVTVTPHLHRDSDVRSDRLAVENRLVFKQRHGSSWLDAPELLLLPHNGRTFDVRVDASALPPGVHYEELQLWDAGAEWRGPLVRIPLTLCKPHVLPSAADGTFSPSQCVPAPSG